MKIIKLLLILILCNGFIYAHEEPPKTLFEKAKKEKSRLEILNNNIKSISAYKLSEDGTKSRILLMGYNAAGFYTNFEQYRNDSLILKVVYGFSAAGNMISDSDYEPDGTFKEENLFKYDAQGRVTGGTSYDENKKMTAFFSFVHAKDKRSIEFFKYHADSSLEYRLVYTYNNDFDMCDYAEAAKYSPEGALQMRVEKQYNKNGDVIKKLVYGADAHLMHYFEYAYDAHGHNTKITRHNAEGGISRTDTFVYNKSGICVEQKAFDAENKLTSEMVYAIQYH